MASSAGLVRLAAELGYALRHARRSLDPNLHERLLQPLADILKDIRDVRFSGITSAVPTASPTTPSATTSSLERRQRSFSPTPHRRTSLTRRASSSSTPSVRPTSATDAFAITGSLSACDANVEADTVSRGELERALLAQAELITTRASTDLQVALEHILADTARQCAALDQAHQHRLAALSSQLSELSAASPGRADARNACDAAVQAELGFGQPALRNLRAPGRAHRRWKRAVRTRSLLWFAADKRWYEELREEMEPTRPGLAARRAVRQEFQEDLDDFDDHRDAGSLFGDGFELDEDPNDSRCQVCGEVILECAFPRCLCDMQGVDDSSFDDDGLFPD